MAQELFVVLDQGEDVEAGELLRGELSSLPVGPGGGGDRQFQVPERLQRGFHLGQVAAEGLVEDLHHAAGEVISALETGDGALLLARLEEARRLRATRYP